MDSKENQLELVVASNLASETAKIKEQEAKESLLSNQKDDTIAANHHQINIKAEDLAELSSLIKMVRIVKTIRGYLYGILFALSMCMANILIKMSPNLDGSNHSAIRYVIQIFVMFFFIKKNNLDYLGPKKSRGLLLFRGVIGCAAVIISFFSISYLDVSDVETLTNSCVLITAIIARLVLHEKLTVCHLVALILNVCGVIFIIRPNFLFGIEENVIHALHLNINASHPSNNSLLHKNMSTRLINGKQLQIMDHSNRETIETIIGVVLVLVSATCMSCAQVAIRKLCLGKIHFSITSIYPAYVGLPSSLIVTLILIFTQSSHADFLNQEAEVISMQILYSIFAGMFGTLGIIFLNKALDCEGIFFIICYFI
jgi:drug/metabolite transporter (DMT)-like permease